MFKTLLTLLIFTASIPAFSDEWYSESLTCWAQGGVRLVSHQPMRALEDFQKAASLIDSNDEFSYRAQFFIQFGKTIAYDMLGFDDQCKQSIGSMVLIMHRENSEESCPFTDQCQIAIKFLRKLVGNSPSFDVQSFLLAILDDAEEEWLQP
jgi:hypothetical protein